MSKRLDVENYVKVLKFLAKSFKELKKSNRVYYKKQNRAEEPLIDALGSLGQQITSIMNENRNLTTELVPMATENILT